MTSFLPPAIFVAEATGLDFLNTRATPAEAEVDWLSDGDGFLDWVKAANLASAADIATVRAQAAPGEIDAAATQARALREWFRGFVTPRLAKPLKAGDLRSLAPLNQLLARDARFLEVFHQEGETPSPFALRDKRHCVSPALLLQPIAAAIAELVCTADFSLVKQCQGAGCTLLFLDKTHGRARRWCSMAICGNRAKQAAYRQKTRSAKG